LTIVKFDPLSKEYSDRIAIGIRATLVAVETIVKGIAGGTIIPPDVDQARTPPHRLRHAPSFVLGGKPTETSVAYTTLSISKLLGNEWKNPHGSHLDKPHAVVNCALEILQGLEQGYVSIEDVRTICRGGPGLRVGSVLKHLREVRKQLEAERKTTQASV
jgi:hypothetical protein